MGIFKTEDEAKAFKTKQLKKYREKLEKEKSEPDFKDPKIQFKDFYFVKVHPQEEDSIGSGSASGGKGSGSETKYDAVKKRTILFTRVRKGTLN